MKVAHLFDRAFRALRQVGPIKSNFDRFLLLAAILLATATACRLYQVDGSGALFRGELFLESDVRIATPVN